MFSKGFGAPYDSANAGKKQKDQERCRHLSRIPKYLSRICDGALPKLY